MAELSAGRPRRGIVNSLGDRITSDPVQVILYVLGGLLVLFLLFVAISNIASGAFTLERFLRLVIFGLAQGSIYALIALGYTLVYGVLMMINFAHGEVFMSGAFIGFFAINALDQTGLTDSHPLLAILITLVVGMAASMVVATVLERIAYRPLRHAPRLVPLISAIGASITLQQLFLRLFGSGDAGTAFGAQLWFWARVLYLPLYLAGIPYVRSLVWGASLIGMLRVAWGLF